MGRVVALLAGISAMAVLAGTARAGAIDVSGFAPYEKCGYCHGADGNSHMPKFPKLAGERFEYLVKQLEDFRNEARDNDSDMMKAVARDLTGEQVHVVAAYFSEQARVPDANGDDPAIGLGQQLFQRGKAVVGVAPCGSCHDGAGGMIAPMLQGQHAGYLEKQLLDFRAGRRVNDPDAVMRSVAQALSDDEIHAVTLYLAGLAPVKDR